MVPPASLIALASLGAERANEAIMLLASDASSLGFDISFVL